MRPTVYISGPLTTSGNVLENVERAIETAKMLIRAGFAPFCPHLTYYLDPATGTPNAEFSHDIWMEIDRALVKQFDALYCLSGESEGGDIEVETADATAVPVFYTLDELRHYFRKGGPNGQKNGGGTVLGDRLGDRGPT